MKKKIIDRIIMVISGLFCMGGAGAAVYAMVTKMLPENMTIAIVCVAAAMLIVGAVSVVLAFMGIKDPKFVKQRAENGDLDIAVSAIDELVRKCVATHDEIVLTNTTITNSREGLSIGLQLSLGSGVSIPLAVAALQKQMKQYITTSTGLDVKDVCVQVDTAEVKDINPTAYVMPDTLGKTPVEEHAEIPGYLSADGCVREEAEELPLHQRIFGAEEQMMVVPEPPVEAEQAETVEEPAAAVEEEVNAPEELPTDEGAAQAEEDEDLLKDAVPEVETVEIPELKFPAEEVQL